MQITYEQLEKNIANLSPIYIVYGDEKYLIDTFIKKLKKAFPELLVGINYIVIDAESIDSFLPNLEMPAFGYDKKLIIVKNSGLFQKDGRRKNPTILQESIINYFNENFDIISETNVIVFVEDAVDKTKFTEEISKYATVCEVNQLKPEALANRLIKVASMYQVSIDKPTCMYFVNSCGTDLQNLINEIRKLIEYCGKGGTITKEIIDDLSIKQIESVIFDLTDNLGNKKIDKALDVLDNLIYQKEPLQRILITLYTHFKRLYFCKMAISSNQNIAQALSLKPNQTFLVNKYKAQSSFFTEEKLYQLLNAFIDLDYNSKIGNIDIDVGLRSVLCNYCS